MKREDEVSQVPRLRRVGNSKEPTPARMLAIASNLRNHLKTYVSISLTANAYNHPPHIPDRGEMKYNVWIASRGSHRFFDTWPEVIGFYREVMGET